MLLNKKKLYQNVLEPNDNSLIWRYLSFEKFVNLITNQTLFFSRIDKFPDQLEGTLPIKNKERLVDEIKNIQLTNLDLAKSYADREEIIISTYRSYSFANCWSKYDAESIALWKIYLNGTRFGVAIQTTYEKLKKVLEKPEYEILLGEVQYCVEVEALQQQTIFLRKTPPYKFENEVRALILNQYTSEGAREGKPRFEYGIEVKIDLVELIDKVYLPPLSPKWFEKTVSEIITKYGYNFELIGSEIIQSL